MDVKLELASLAILFVSIAMLQQLPKQIRQHSTVLKVLFGMNLFFIIFDLTLLIDIWSWKVPITTFSVLFGGYYLIVLLYPACFFDFIFDMTVVNSSRARRALGYVPAILLQIVVLVGLPIQQGITSIQEYPNALYPAAFKFVMLNWVIYNIISLIFYLSHKELIGETRFFIYMLILGCQVVAEVVETISNDVAVSNFCMVYVLLIFVILFFYVDHTYDPLTGIYSENGFYRATQGMLARAKSGQYMLVHADFHRFRQVNERYGDKVGDEILKLAAADIQKLVSGIGTYGRLHADDFLMCLPVIKLDQVQKEFDVSRIVPGAQMTIPCFYGVYYIEDPGMPVKQIADRAQYALNMIHDQYMQHIVYFTEEMERELTMERILEQEMVPALKDGQFEVYYQPIMDVKTGEIHSAEALIRWNHPEWGMIAPARFIPLFERNGFITELDRFVLRQVCRRQSILTASGGKKVPVSVNVSRKDLENDDFAEAILGILKDYTLDPEDIKFEITESSFAQDEYQIREKIEKLRERGYKIMMDDFGSGYSSFNVFGKLPVDILKIDMLFVRQSDNERGKTVLRSVVAMAKALNMPMVAEGAETKEQVDLLSELGCEHVQGYYFAKPMKELDFDKRLNQKKTI
ncbi:MAG: GGDEF domain-containing phosphodiesterase [Lachnospiraceae bacterium]|nr:GGDEF domain-containing phosphodiesterase [Lachnospiraceae bacterium]